MKLSDFSIINDKKEKDNLNQFIENLNNTKTDYPKDKTVHYIFSQQAAKTPDAIAVIYEGRNITYRELDLRSNKLANFLISNNIAKESAVALMLDRSIEVIVTLLGIIKAGGAYFPIKSDLPLDRIQYMVKDSDSKILIFGKKYLKQAQEIEQKCKSIKNILCIDGKDICKYDKAHLDKYPNSHLNELSGPQNLAYIIYTSGTSGNPKGVMIEHRSILRLVLNTNYIDLKPSDTVLQTGELAFDASTFEIWGPLLNGGSVCLPRGNDLLDAVELGKLIKKEKVNTIFLTTGLFNQLAETDISVFQGLKTLLTGGEKVSVKSFTKVKNTYPDLALKHVYGPTENTTFTTSFDFKEAYSDDIPIGLPISNTTLYVLDQNLALTPIGVSGELFTGGDGLARGYLNDTELTAKKFIPNPFKKGEKLYRTGDLTRMMPDGNIEFLGRLDTQVKIRGSRIELEEVEKPLLQNPLIKEAVVTAKDINGSGKELIAYIAGDKQLNTSMIRDYLADRLPDFMTPSYFIFLDKMPLKPNGKVDRNALPEPETSKDVSKNDYIAPQTKTEKELAIIWEATLNCKNIGTKDNFFDLGGHSLKVTKMLSIIQDKLNVELPFTTVFSAPTIGELAQCIEDGNKINSAVGFGLKSFDKEMALINKTESKNRLFAFPPGTGYFVVYNQLAKSFDNWSFYGLNFIHGQTRLDEYIDLITTADPDGPYKLFGWSAGGKLAYHVALALEKSGQKVSAVIMVDSARYFKEVKFTPKEILEHQHNFLKHFTSKVLKEKVVEHITNYYNYISESIETQTIDADIHLITGENSQDAFYNESKELIADKKGWADITKGKFFVYEGHGEHKNMMNSPNLEQNAQLIQKILSNL